MKNSLCIHHHLGLGDHFDCNGMVRYIMEKNSFYKVYVFSKSNYFNMIKYMYRDDDKIEVVKIDKDKNEIAQVEAFLKDTEPEFFLKVGFDKYPPPHELAQNKNCWEYFYEQVKIPYNVRTDYFYVERDLEEETRLLGKLNPDGGSFLFMHDDPSRGYTMNRDVFSSGVSVIENDNSENIFHFIKILEEAEEIHCMESSFKSLIDFYSKTPSLYYHDFRNQPLGEKTNRQWSTVSYD